MRIKNSIWLLPALLFAGCSQVMTSDDHDDGMRSTARIRVVHASPDAPSVDVCADGSILFAGAPFFGATEYASVPAGTYRVKVVAADAGCASNGVIEADLAFTADTDSTVAAIDELSSIQPLVLADDNETPDGGMASVRFVHASPDAPTVDITLDDGTTLFDDIAFGEQGAYIMVPAGIYDLDVRDMTGETVVLDVNGVQLEAGIVYTVWATGFLNAEPALTPQITVDN
jgi:hypothetical protein